MSNFAEKRAQSPGPALRPPAPGSAAEGGSSSSALAFPIQRKVAVGSAHDPAEVEAERTAATVVTALAGLSRPGAPDAQPGRTGEHAAGCGCHDPQIQRRAPGSLGLDGGDLSAEVEQDLRSAGGGGRGIDPELRSRLEDTMGADLSSVRLHAGDQAERLNRSMSAEAFTHGRDIYFRDGLPDTGTASGLHLLAHEVTHTVQQGTSPVAPVRRMTASAGKLKGPVSTLQQLNAVIADLKLKGGAIDAEAIETGAGLDKAPSATEIDLAVAAANAEITTKTTRSTLIKLIADKLKNPKPAEKEKDPETLRTEAAKALKPTASDGTGGSYLCGGADEPHVHLYSDGFHLKKLGGVDRINVVQSNKLYPDGLIRAREAASADYRGYQLHIAIDKCLIALKESLDDYEY